MIDQDYHAMATGCGAKIEICSFFLVFIEKLLFES
jgi:hypothetical protein